MTQPRPPTPVLDWLENERILSATLEDGGIRLREECDGYYSVVLRPESVRQLAAELLRLIDGELTPNPK